MQYKYKNIYTKYNIQIYKKTNKQYLTVNIHQQFKVKARPSGVNLPALYPG